MDFVDEEDDFLTVADFLHQFLHPLFKLTANTCPLNQADDIQADDFLALQFVGDRSIHNLLGKAFYNGCLTNPRLSNEDRVVFGPAVEDFDDPSDFLVAANDRVNISFPGNFRDIDTKLIQQALRLLRRLRTAASILAATAITASLGWRGLFWSAASRGIAWVASNIIEKFAEWVHIIWIAKVPQALQDGIVGIGFHDLVAVMAEVHLLLFSIEICIKMNSCIIDFTVLTKHSNSSF